MNKQYLPFFATVIIALLVIAPGIAGADSKTQFSCPTGYQNVTAIQAEKILEKGNVYLLDVRIPAEYNYTHIEGAKLIPLRNALGSNLDPSIFLENRTVELPKNKNTKIVVYCKGGTRSAPACDFLIKIGYKKVYNMQGGITEWVKTGYPVIVDPTFWTANYPTKA
jgi:rhodanese-related sulfurtransferase